MSVSPWLQRYFDSKQQKKKAIKRKFKKIQDDIDPAFQASFQTFKKQLLSIVDNNPGNEDIISDELDVLWAGVKKSNGKYNVKLGAAIINKSK